MCIETQYLYVTGPLATGMPDQISDPLASFDYAVRPRRPIDWVTDLTPGDIPDPIPC